MLVSFGQICLLDRTKWPERRYLSFNPQEILNRKEEGTLRATAAGGLFYRPLQKCSSARLGL